MVDSSTQIFVMHLVQKINKCHNSWVTGQRAKDPKMELVFLKLQPIYTKNSYDNISA